MIAKNYSETELAMMKYTLSHLEETMLERKQMFVSFVTINGLVQDAEKMIAIKIHQRMAGRERKQDE